MPQRIRIGRRRQEDCFQRSQTTPASPQARKAGKNLNCMALKPTCQPALRGPLCRVILFLLFPQPAVRTHYCTPADVRVEKADAHALHPLHSGHLLPRECASNVGYRPPSVVPTGPPVLHHQNVSEEHDNTPTRMFVWTSIDVVVCHFPSPPLLIVHRFRFDYVLRQSDRPTVHATEGNRS